MAPISGTQLSARHGKNRTPAKSGGSDYTVGEGFLVTRFYVTALKTNATYSQQKEITYN